MSGLRPALPAADERSGDRPGLADSAFRALDEAPCWPVTRLAAWSLTVVLGISILAPTLVVNTQGIRWTALLLPVIVVTLTVRALFEALGSTAGSRRRWRRVTAAAPPALLAATLMAVLGTIVGAASSLLTDASTAALSMLTLVAAGAVRELEVRMRLRLRRVYFIGSHEPRLDLARELSRRSDARLVGALAIDSPAERARVIEAVRDARATVLVLDGDAMRVPELVDAASQLNLAGIHVRDLVSYYESEFKKIPLGELSPTWFLFDIASVHRRRAYDALRWAVQAVLAGVLLLLTLPALLLSILAIKLTSTGPALYRQRRVGKGGTEFTLVKLRTMTRGTESGPAWAGSQTHRVTQVGRWLRRFRLDELPQLWNVIRGDLALVGPRPEQVPIAERLDRELPHYSARHCIRPGITGWAQVNLGYSGSYEGTIAKLQRDLYYVKHSSLRLDVLILWLTMKAILSGRG